MRIPRTKITLAKQALDLALVSIQSATEKGAQVLAQDEVGEAITLRDQALSQCDKGGWRLCRELATRSRTAAERAVKIASSQRAAPSEATLTSRFGKVQTWKPGGLEWFGTRNGQSLAEREKVRTLSSSEALVTFLDESRLRLGPNSQAIIEAIRLDKLRDRQSARVKLVEGDVYALLVGSKRSKSVDLQAPGISSDTSSLDYWVSKQGITTKVANYDQEEMQVSSGGKTVVLQQDQGTSVRGNAAPLEPHDLLPPPRLSGPEDARTLFSDHVDLSWEPLDGANAYIAELARDADFTDAARSPSRSSEAQLTLRQLPNGTYYWRLKGVDRLGFPGARSRVRRFRVLRDTTPPYLMIEKPKAGPIIKSRRLEVQGLTEAEAELRLRGTLLSVEPDGRFRIETNLKPGENVLVFEARDPAGNLTRRQIKLIYEPERQLAIQFSNSLIRIEPRLFLTRNPNFSISGRTSPKSKIDVVGEDWNGSTYSSNGGLFELQIPLQPGRQEFEMQVTDPAGYQAPFQFGVVLDLEPPLLEMGESPPRTTAQPSVKVAGRAEGAEKLELNGELIALSGNRFEIEVPLQEGGNSIELIAQDRAGNEAYWQASVILDRASPVLLASNVSPRTARGGEAI